MSSDMTIESALADPIIRALMRADRVEPQAVERLLRSTAETLDRSPRIRLPAIVAARPSPSLRGLCCA